MESRTFRTDELVGLGVAVLLHIAIVAILLTQPEPEPVTVPERVTVSLATDVGLADTAPEPVPESRAPAAPVLADTPGALDTPQRCCLLPFRKLRQKQHRHRPGSGVQRQPRRGVNHKRAPIGPDNLRREGHPRANPPAALRLSELRRNRQRAGAAEAGLVLISCLAPEKAQRAKKPVHPRGHSAREKQPACVPPLHVSFARTGGHRKAWMRIRL